MKCSEWSKRAPCPGGTCRPVAPSSTGSWLLPVANVDCSVLRTQTLPSLALCAYIYIFFFLLQTCVHLLDNCIFYFLSQTRKKCVWFSCIVYKVENKAKYERGKKKTHNLIYFILILVFLFKYFVL